jgi:DNA-nicking Smr family endonuclease
MSEDDRSWEKETLFIEPLKKNNKFTPEPKKVIKEYPRPTQYFFIEQQPSSPTFMAQNVDTRYFEKTKITSKLDLHGLTKAQAMDRLLSFFTIAQFKGYKTVIVITGKGKESSVDDSGFGIIRTSTIEWFKNNPAYVVSYAVCKPHDGGLGAFYVHVRGIKKNKL